MATHTYTYGNTDINIPRLTQEIQSSDDITIALGHINIEAGQLAIYMKAELSDPEETALDALVSAHVNTPLADPDPLMGEDATLLVRPQASPVGWSFQLHGLLYTTAKEGSARQALDNSADPHYLTEKFYDESGTQVSGLDVATKACQTVIEWEPPWDYQLLGGMFHQKVSPSGEIILNVTAVPDIPKQFGGSIPFVVSTDLNFIGPDAGLELDAQSVQKLTYTPGYGTNKLRFSLHHASGLQHDMYIGLKIFKERTT